MAAARGAGRRRRARSSTVRLERERPEESPRTGLRDDEKGAHQKGHDPHVALVEYKELHPDGYEYSQFCQLYRTWRKKLDVTMRQDHKAGEKLFVDFPGLTIPIYDERTLEVAFRAELFVAVLGASNYLYAEALRSQELVHWCHAHENAFAFFKGCPAICVSD